MANLSELDLTDQLVVGKQVEKGGFANISRGILYRLNYPGPATEVAIKSLRMTGHITDTAEGRISKRFHREVLLWRKLQHPNVVPLLGYSRSLDGSLNMVSPWYQGGNVILYLKSHPQSNRFALALDAIDGLIYIHSVQVAHGDLKGENVLVDEFGRASLCDFGMSQFIDETNRIRGYTTSHGDLGGTYSYMCPEVFAGQPKSIATDMWAAGCLIVQILTDTTPYHGAPTIGAIYGAMMSGQPPSTNIDGKIEAGLWNWIEKCWNKTPTDRPTATEMRTHLASPFLNTESRPSAGSLQCTGTHMPPIGVVRLWLKKATELKNVEATLGGKSDPYVCVWLNGVVKSRTDVVNNNLNPEWDQIIYVPVHSLREIMILNVVDHQTFTKDRSLGTVELKIADLAAEDTNKYYPYCSTGKKERTEKVELDEGTYKGSLQFTAEFIPSLNLKGLKFDKNERASSSDEEMERIPESATYNMPKKPKSRSGHVKATSVDTTVTYKTTMTNNTANTASPADKAKGAMELSRDELMGTQSGIIIVDVKSGTLAKNARLEVLLNDSYWPAFSTERLRSTNAKWDQVGEVFIKELDFSRVWLRLNENDEGEKDDIIGEFKIDAKHFLEQCLEKEAEFELTTEDRRYVSKLVIVAKYAPVTIQLEPRECVDNMGILRVDLLDGKEIHGADRSGKSDPFVVFSLNDERVYKSQVKKKTLTPAWNENFTVMVPSRVGASFVLEVFDWNQIEQAKSLGTGIIELSNLEPFQVAEQSIPINSNKYGETGKIRVRLMFQPEIIAKARKNASTFSTAGRVMTQIGVVPFGAGRGVVQGVGTVGKKAKGLFSRNKTLDEEDEPSAQELPVGQMPAPAGPSNGPNGLSLPADNTAIPAGSATSPATESGLLRVVVVAAKDLSLMGESSVKPYLVLKVGKEEFKTKYTGKTLHPEWDEVFSMTVGPETKSMNATIYNYKTLGKDRILGEAEIDIWRHIQPNGLNPITAADVWLELREGAGLLRLRLEFEMGIGIGLHP